MKRRTILQVMAGGLATAPLMAFKRKQGLRRKRGSIKKLLVIFQRGGNDSLNTLVPLATNQYNLYRGLRPDLGFTNSQLLGVPGGYFGMHPAMSSLSPILSAGHLSFVHCVGYPGADRSHFESQSYYETGVPGNGLLGGWINRYLANTVGGGGLIRGIAVGYTIPQLVQGQVAVPVSANFGRSEIATDNNMSSAQADAYRSIINQNLSFTPPVGNEAVYDTGQKIFDMVESFSTRDLSDYSPENGAVYPAGGFGNHIMHAAQMLKDSPNHLGIETCVINQGGYDTHANQISPGNPTDPGATHYRLLGQLSDGMAAFYRDMGPARMQDTLVLVISEFGRRAYQNDSNGSDHGIGSLAMLMGANVSGEAHNGGGAWPGLNHADLIDGGDLAWVTDFRDIYWEILTRHMGVSNSEAEAIIPGHVYSPLNVL